MVSMKHEEFLIGKEFWCGGNKWRCTDIGTRVIVAISLGSHEIVLARRSDKTPDLLDMQYETTDAPCYVCPYLIPRYYFSPWVNQGF
jgi:hypothetical protein